VRCQCQRQVGVTETLLGCRVGTGPPARAAATEELRGFGGEERRIEQRELGRRRGRAGEWRRRAGQRGRRRRSQARVGGPCWLPMGALLEPWSMCTHDTRDRDPALELRHPENEMRACAKQDGCNAMTKNRRMLDDQEQQRPPAHRARPWFSPAGRAKTAQQPHRTALGRLRLQAQSGLGRVASPSSAAPLGTQSNADGRRHTFAGG
jgi:hypothetical protein